MIAAAWQRFAARLQPRPRLEDASAAGQLVYAIGDIHGRFDLLQVLLGRIAGDCLDRAEGRRPVLVFCGDYVDRGPHPAQVLEALCRLRQSGRFDLRLLKGNHEQALLAFLDAPAGGVAWLRNGGAETLVGYGVAPPDPAGGEPELTRARDALLARLPASHLRLLRSLELMVVVGDYAFVHAGIRPGVALSDQVEEDLLWIREDFIRARGPFEKIVVHGHSWTSPSPQVLSHRIGIDTGAYATGVLSAVRIEDGRVGVLQTGAAADKPWDPWIAPPSVGPGRAVAGTARSPKAP